MNAERLEQIKTYLRDFSTTSEVEFWMLVDLTRYVDTLSADLVRTADIADKAIKLNQDFDTMLQGAQLEFALAEVKECNDRIFG